MKMNTKFWLSGLLFAGLLSTQDVRAFYNPSTGRWLSRDPYWEDGFKGNVALSRPQPEQSKSLLSARFFDNNKGALYVFVGNDPGESIDLLGLSDCKQCGRAVDRALRLTHDDVFRRFNQLGFWKKAKACGPIWFPVSNFMAAWDLDDMTWYWGNNMRCGASTCDQTVTVGGKCYNAWDVNYMSYGWAGSLCGMNASQLADHIILFKILKVDPARLPGALWFGNLGWLGLYSPLPPEIWPIGYPACAACRQAYQTDLESQWPSKLL